MAISDTSRSKLRYIKEVTWNVTPASAMQEITHTGESLTYGISTTVSNEIRSDRQITELVQTSAESSGGINFEVRAKALDDFLEGALFDSFSTTVAVAETDISASSGDNSFNTIAGDFTTENLSVGQWIEVAGFTNASNNGYAKIISIATGKIIVAGLTLVTEAAGDSITMNGSMLRNGVTKKSFSIENEFNDIGEFLWYSGMIVSSMSLEVATGAIVSSSFNFMGGSHDSAQATIGTGSAIAAITGSLLNGVNNVSNIREGGSPIAAGIYIQKLSLAVDNGLRSQQALASLAPVGVGVGRCNVTGSMDVYYANDDLYTKFVNGTSTSISYRLTDDNGAGYIITLPNIEFTGGTPNASGADADVIIPLAFQALRDTATDCTIQIDRFI